MKIGPLERFSAADLGPLSRLPATVGWHDTEADWRTILAVGTAFGHRDHEGQIVSSGVLFSFGEVASIGKMIVHPDCRGLGLARAVLTACLEARSPAVRHTTLVATALGEPVYRRMGFAEIGRVHKLFAPGLAALPLPSPAPSRLASRDRDGESVTFPATLDEARALDALAYGSDRGALLGARLEQSTESAMRRGEGGEAIGLAMVTAALDFSVVGPILAPSAEGALRLVRALGARTPGRLRVDIPDHQEAFFRALLGEGFAEVDFPPVMSLGGTRAPGHREALFALASQAFG